MAKVEGLLAEAEADYRADQSTVQQIFNTQIIIEKHLQRQRDLFHNFIDFKKALTMSSMQTCGRSSEASK